ncbi:guanidinium exporter (modular protein) [Nitrospira defluvii]|uniref:Guanidinium exporter n=2 Tax=Nitrospira defluvii TaxID=330214 RepID=A0ABM8RCH5_9BACT|nr:guanidinium exporter (modular protein) [Nitrospira defluvii]
MMLYDAQTESVSGSAESHSPIPPQEGYESNPMAWTFLVVAGLLEICWAIGLKYTEGFSRFWPTAVTLVAMAASFGCLAQALKSIPVGTGYAVWTGIGAAGTAVLGMVIFAETVSLIKVASLLCIILGIIGLKSSA